MVVVVLIALFIVSNVAVVSGYYNTMSGFDTAMAQMVYEEIDVLAVSFVLTALVPINLIVAFFTSRGSYQGYKGELMALSLATPFLVVFSALPGESDIRGLLQFNPGPLFALVVASQIGACHILKDKAWIYGGRKVGA